MKLGAPRTPSRPWLELQLHDNQPLRLEHARGLTLRGVAGQVWITLAGEAEDIFLMPGEEYEIPRNALLLIEGIGEASVALLRPVRYPWLRALLAQRRERAATLTPGWSLQCN
ncbi:DUF2917 domain-containing protein [Dechloromonas sp. ZY10]|uniref:DUF2917 domain-containing protein n=1 Tax=Dechloromonas aquae TaxID=2664436 RepID=UPI0035298481